MNPEHYTYRVTWSPEDSEYVATVAEFPSLSWLADNQSDALDGLVRLVGGVLSDMVNTGEVPPDPLSDRTYSGRFLIRIPPEMHRQLVIEAAEQNISLNRLVSARLSDA